MKRDVRTQHILEVCIGKREALMVQTWKWEIIEVVWMGDSDISGVIKEKYLMIILG